MEKYEKLPMFTAVLNTVIFVCHVFINETIYNTTGATFHGKFNTV